MATASVTDDSFEADVLKSTTPVVVAARPSTDA